MVAGLDSSGGNQEAVLSDPITMSCLGPGRESLGVHQESTCQQGCVWLGTLLMWFQVFGPPSGPQICEVLEILGDLPSQMPFISLKGAACRGSGSGALRVPIDSS